MKTIFGETLPEGQYMLWRYDSKGGSAVPLEHFVAKYGYVPTQVILSKNTDFDADDWGLEQIISGLPAQPKHILLR